MKTSLPKAIAEAELRIGSLTLKCHVLDDGRRVLEEESFLRFMAWLGSGGPPTSRDDIERLCRFIRGVK